MFDLRVHENTTTMVNQCPCSKCSIAMIQATTGSSSTCHKCSNLANQTQSSSNAHQRSVAISHAQVWVQCRCLQQPGHNGSAPIVAGIDQWSAPQNCVVICDNAVACIDLNYAVRLQQRQCSLCVAPQACPLEGREAGVVARVHVGCASAVCQKHGHHVCLAPSACA